MLFAVPVRPGMRARIPAVVHVDGSARPQAVTREANPRFHALLHAFAAHTGVPVLLNTSFNVAGEPRVCRPPEAVAAAVAMPLDALVLGDFLALPA
jgi:carbamoyltransferase